MYFGFSLTFTNSFFLLVALFRNFIGQILCKDLRIKRLIKDSPLPWWFSGRTNIKNI